MKIAKILLSIGLTFSLFAGQFADAQRVVVRVEPRHRHHARPVVIVAPRPVYVAPRPVVVNSWEILGTRVVNFNTDRDVIRVAGADRGPAGRGPADNFRQLKFVVQDAAIEILDMDVIYENGGHDDIPVRQVVERGGESRFIDLRGGSRRIRQVSFVYRSVPGFSGRRASLTLLGIR